MATVEVSIDSVRGITVFTVVGDLTIDEIVHYAKAHYGHESAKLVLWDLTRGTVHTNSVAAFRSLARTMRELTEARAGGKTAFVGNLDADFGTGRMYEAFSELERLPVSYRTFRKRADAETWLMGG